MDAEGCTASNSHDAKDNRTSMTDARGNTTSCAYDDQGRSEKAFQKAQKNANVCIPTIALTIKADCDDLIAVVTPNLDGTVPNDIADVKISQAGATCKHDIY